MQPRATGGRGAGSERNRLVKPRNPYKLFVHGRTHLTANPSVTDTDWGDRADTEYATKGTSPLLADTDCNGFSTDPWKADSDGDGLADNEYFVKGTDPTRPDTDRDGFKDDPDACAREGVAHAAPSRSRSQQALSLGPLSC